MYTRRQMIAAAASIAGSGLLIGCANSVIDPQKVHDMLVEVCGIAVPIANIIAIIASAAKGSTIQVIVDLICSAYKSAVRSGKLGAPAVGSKVIFVVVVNGKEIEVEAEVVK